VFLLGRFEVCRGDDVIPRSAWKRRRPVELLTALALAPDHALHREELIDRMWPDKALDAGANNLYRTLHELRRVGGEKLVSTAQGMVRLAEHTWVDVGAFERAAAGATRESLAKAVALYRGDLLPDDPYAEALGARREGLRQRFVDAALRLSELAEDPREQIDVLRRVLALDNTIEEAHRRLMHALASTDRKKDALQQYAICVQALRERLDTTPSPQTRALHRSIESGALGARPAAAPKLGWAHVAARLLGTKSPPPVFGRDGMLAQIATFAAGKSGLLFLAGEAGLGKTRLAVECARQCCDRGDTVLVGLGYDLQSTAPYTAFVDAWTDHLRALDRPQGDNPFAAFSPTPGASAQEDRMRLFESVERSLVDLAGDRSVCLIIEDLHQADESSLYLLYHLARAARHLPLKIVGTFRDEEVRVGSALHTVLAGVGRERLSVRLALTRLDRAQTAQLIGAMGDGAAPSEQTVDEVYSLCGGNPFYTEEVVRGLHETGNAVGAAPTDDLHATVRERVSRLGPDAERLFVAASIVGLRFDFETVRAALSMDAGTALDALDRGLAARVVEEQDNHYRFRHALTRQALSSSLSNARRVHLHGAIADVLERSADAVREQPERLAQHHQAAGRRKEALPHLLAAAERARGRLGFGEAVAFCEQALALSDALNLPDGPAKLELLSSMGGMRVALGDLSRAVQDLQAAAALGNQDWAPSPSQRANALRLSALALIEAGDLQAAGQNLDDALLTLRDDPDSPELSHAFYLYAQLRWHEGRYADAYAFGEKSLAEAERLEDQTAIARGYEMLALACHSIGEWKKGTEFERRRSDLADGPLDVASAFDVHL